MIMEPRPRLRLLLNLIFIKVNFLVVLIYIFRNY